MAENNEQNEESDVLQQTMFSEIDPFEFIERIFLLADVKEINNALEKYIITVSSHPKILEHKLATLPPYPDHNEVAQKHVRSIDRRRILQQVIRLNLELEGDMHKLVNREYYRRLRTRALDLHKLLSREGLFDISKATAQTFLLGDEGAVRPINY